jgi:hypothetical protein
VSDYDIHITAQIEISGTFEAPNRDLAIETAKRELRLQGEIQDIVIERAIYIDPNE